MAFRRVRRGFPRFGQKTKLGRALGRKAQKRYDHANAVDAGTCSGSVEFPTSVCGQGEDPPEVNPGRIVLLSDSTKEQFFEDSCSVVGIECHLEFRPRFTFASSDLLDQFGQRNAWNFEFFGGIRKIREHYQGEPVDPTLPGLSDLIPSPILFPNDRTDLFWIRRKWKRSVESDRFTQQLGFLIEGAIIGVCSPTTAPAAGAPANTLSNGSGTINIPAISTDCCQEVCRVETPFGEIHTNNIRFPTNLAFVKHDFRSRRRISLKGKEALVYDFEVVVPFAFADDTPVVDVSGWVDLVIET